MFWYCHYGRNGNPGIDVIYVIDSLRTIALKTKV